MGMGVNDRLSAHWKGLQDKPEQLKEAKSHLLLATLGEDCRGCGEPRYKIGVCKDHQIVACLNPACPNYGEVEWIY